MKKKIVFLSSVVVIAFAFISLSVSLSSKKGTNLFLLNVEALAGETGNPCPDPYDVYGRYIEATVVKSNYTSNSKGEIKYGDTDKEVQAGYEAGKQYKCEIELKNCDGKNETSCCPQSSVGATLKTAVIQD